jgi:hypothetical protein
VPRRTRDKSFCNLSRHPIGLNKPGSFVDPCGGINAVTALFRHQLYWRDKVSPALGNAIAPAAGDTMRLLWGRRIAVPDRQRISPRPRSDLPRIKRIHDLCLGRLPIFAVNGGKKS